MIGTPRKKQLLSEFHVPYSVSAQELNHRRIPPRRIKYNPTALEVSLDYCLKVNSMALWPKTDPNLQSTCIHINTS